MSISAPNSCLLRSPSNVFPGLPLLLPSALLHLKAPESPVISVLPHSGYWECYPYWNGFIITQNRSQREPANQKRSVQTFNHTSFLAKKIALSRYIISLIHQTWMCPQRVPIFHWKMSPWLQQRDWKPLSNVGIVLGYQNFLRWLPQGHTHWDVWILTLNSQAPTAFCKCHALTLLWLYLSLSVRGKSHYRYNWTLPTGILAVCPWKK